MEVFNLKGNALKNLKWPSTLTYDLNFWSNDVLFDVSYDVISRNLVYSKTDYFEPYRLDEHFWADTFPAIARNKRILVKHRSFLFKIILMFFEGL